jgi:hypothetical protein
MLERGIYLAPSQVGGGVTVTEVFPIQLERRILLKNMHTESPRHGVLHDSSTLAKLLHICYSLYLMHKCAGMA